MNNDYDSRGARSAASDGPLHAGFWEHAGPPLGQVRRSAEGLVEPFSRWPGAKPKSLPYRLGIGGGIVSAMVLRASSFST